MNRPGAELMEIKLAVLTTAFFPNLKPLRMFVESARKYGVHPIRYMGYLEQYRPWAEMKIKNKIPELKQISRAFSHVLYTDGRDAFFTGPMEEILLKYQAMGSPPCLASTEPNCNPNSSMIEHYPDVGKYRFHCVGGYLAEIPWMIDKFQRMLPYIDGAKGKLSLQSGDDAEIWQWAWAQGWFRPVLDSKCEIFQTFDHAGSDLQIIDGRLANALTGSSPCIFHLNGGYSDPINGKYNHMINWWDALNPDIPLRKKDCSL